MPVNTILMTLKEKQAQLINRIGAIERDFRKGRPADFAEQTSGSENDEVLDEIFHEAKAELRQVNAALVRIDNGEYGYCLKCSKRIAAERLKVLPYTNICINFAH